MKKAVPQSDHLLVQEAINGQEEAFIQLYHRYVSPLYFFVFQKTSHAADAEDLTSETFFQALKDLKKFSYKSTFKNWLFGIAKHLILAHYRQKYQHSTVELHENITPEKIEENPEKEQKDFNKIKQILSSLPEKYRHILELRFLKGYSVLETAAALGISEENAKVLQHRALKKAKSVTLDTLNKRI